MTPEELADALYDALSEALRARPRHVGEAHEVIRSADRAMTALDEHLRGGGVLPSPWRRSPVSGHTGRMTSTDAPGSTS
ncbi:hypothetical protein [Nocardiopsis quinghaiensis]|uniref:hypothetical protein n=1 Tax=Nocardiopsis quinghaiensis TaxID=464995 RepID=UPI00123A5250|nr:hypothetical protein [Nocardiopsis quinghaiensis]